MSGTNGRWASLPYCLGCGEYGPMLGPGGSGVFVALELFDDVTGHRDVKCASTPHY